MAGELKLGSIVGPWKLSARIGSGGNGVVFKATDGHVVVAVKVLKSPKRLSRFADEIRAMERCRDLPGVMPIVGSFLSAESKDPPFWLAMPLAVPLVEALGKDPSFEKTVAAIRGVTAALVAVHELGISHRDIKPDNLFHFKGEWVVGDFGLADFEGKESETALMEKVGPMHYIAPEMLNEASTADGKAADVYSLAKTMWVLCTGQRYPLPGHQLVSIEALTISAYANHPRAALFDKLIEHSTNYSPEKRPTMQEFLREVDAWIEGDKVEQNAVRPDLGEFKRLLEGRSQKAEENEKARLAANEYWTNQAVRLREKFREIFIESGELLSAAGLKYRDYGTMDFAFTIRAEVPPAIGRHERHCLEILAAVHPKQFEATHCLFQAFFWYTRNDLPQFEKEVIWESERNFLTGGSEENQQVIAAIQDLREQLTPAIRKVLVAAGVL